MKNINQISRPIYNLLIVLFLIGFLNAGMAQTNQTRFLQIQTNNFQNPTINQNLLSNLQRTRVPNLVGIVFNRDTLETILDGTPYVLGEIKAELSSENRGLIIEQQLRTDLMLDGITPIDITYASVQIPEDMKRERIVPGLLTRVPEVLVQMQKVKVPMLEGEIFDLNRISEILRENRLQIGDTISIVDNQRQGQIIRQYPPAQREVNINTRVNVAFGIGTEASQPGEVPELIVVRNFIGENINQVQLRIETDLLLIGNVRKIENSAQEGTILEQFPEAGMEVDPFTPVNFVISSGTVLTEELITVPNLFGMNLEQVARTLQSEGLSIGSIQEEISVEPAQTVIQQNPQPGTPVSRQTQIDILVALNEFTQVIVPNLLNVQQNIAAQIAMNAGLIPVVKNAKNTNDFGIISEQFPKAGTVVNLGSELTLIVKGNKKSANNWMKIGGGAFALLLSGGVAVRTIKLRNKRKPGVQKNVKLRLKPIADAGKQNLNKTTGSKKLNSLRFRIITDLGTQTIKTH